MVSQKSVEKQLKHIGFNLHGWGRGELSELPHILLEDEEIYECVNGMYEGGFALLVATDVRLLLIDKKPLNFLTVEDLRFDMINEMDYNHRLIGADINISAGSKNLTFRSYNQPRLRKLIGHVQHCMAEAKKKQSTHQEGQNNHLREINQQLQSYLIAQQQYQLQLQQIQNGQVAHQQPVEMPKPSAELSDYLYAQGLLSEYQKQTGYTDIPVQPEVIEQIKASGANKANDAKPAANGAKPPAIYAGPTAVVNDSLSLYQDGLEEVFGRHQKKPAPVPKAALSQHKQRHDPLEINPMNVAYSKLPMALRNRKFGRPSFHAHSEATTMPEPLKA